MVIFCLHGQSGIYVLFKRSWFVLLRVVGIVHVNAWHWRAAPHPGLRAPHDCFGSVHPNTQDHNSSRHPAGGPYIERLILLKQAPSSRKPSEEQKRVSTLLVEAMTIPEREGDKGNVRAGLALNPVRQGING